MSLDSICRHLTGLRKHSIVSLKFQSNCREKRFRKKELGGGTILDLGVYPIQFSQFVFRSEPVSITAKGTLNEDGVDIETEVELKYANGGVTRFKTSALKELENKANIRGSKNFMTVNRSIGLSLTAYQSF